MFAPRRELVKETAATTNIYISLNTMKDYWLELLLLLLFFFAFFFITIILCKRFLCACVYVCVCIRKRRQKCLLARIFFTLSVYIHLYVNIYIAFSQCAAFTLGVTFAFFETVCAPHLENTLRMFPEPI